MKKITYIIVVFLLIGIFFMFNKNNNITLDEVKINNNNNNVTFAMYKENNEGEYEPITNTEEFPQVPYILDEDKSKCINSDGNIIDNSLKQTIEDNKIFVETDEEAYCYLYFKMGTFEYLFDYTGSEQEFIVPYAGKYIIELWGGGGYLYGSNTETSPIGGYVSGNIVLTKSDRLYIYVGQRGIHNNGGYNGGGTGRVNHTLGYRYGGGASDVRLLDGNWNDSASLKSRIIVAAAGGYGYTDSDLGGKAGGLTGYDFYDSQYPTYRGRGGTQTSGGTTTNYGSYAAGTSGRFGYGGNGGASDTTSIGQPGGSSGGGSGYYGGGGGAALSAGTWGGGGGSSFISGHNGCVAIESSASLTPRLDSNGNRCVNGTTDIECSKHYSGYVFTDTVMIDGAGYKWTTVKGSQVQMPAPDGTLYPLGQGHAGNGYAKITYIGN